MLIKAMKKIISLFLVFFGLTSFANAEKIDCIIVKQGDKTIIQEGKDCGTAYSPNSSFKIPLAVIGFESGILKTAHNPIWKTQKPVTFLKYFHDGEQSPSSWMRWSMPWYSQILTQKMGMKKFQEYINRMNYGNMDLSGDFTKSNLELSGEITKGLGLANALECPTLNLKPREKFSIKDGVFLCYAYIDNKKHNAICYYDKSRVDIVEIHVLDKEIFDVKSAKIKLLSFVRPKLKFSTEADLKSQIKFDIDIVRRKFESETLYENNGLSDSWLSSSLKITTIEQIEFIEKLAKNALPFSKISQIKAKDLLKLMEAGSWNGWTLHGKTGTSDFDKINVREGYFVGFAEKNGEIISFVIHTSGDIGDKNAKTGGLQAKKILLYRMTKDGIFN